MSNKDSSGSLNKGSLSHILKSTKRATMDAISRGEYCWGDFTHTGDRGIAIIAGCYLDYLLEQILRSAYIQDKGVNELFKDDHILQTLSAKANIAYFSGFIPSYIYHDLKVVRKIRNKFAHDSGAQLSFDDKSITAMIDNCKLRPTTIDDCHAPKLKFNIVVTQIGAYLMIIADLLKKLRPPRFMEVFNFEDMNYKESALTKDEIMRIQHSREEDKETSSQD